MSNKIAPRSGWPFYAGVFLVSAATLMLQVVQTRILSVVAWYYLAFFVISMAMFGLTAGAVWVYMKRDRFTQRTLSSDLTSYSTLLGIVIAGALVVQMVLTPVLVLTVTTLIDWGLLAISIASPFFVSGIIVSLALTRSALPVGRVYSADLVGGAFGCLAALILINVTDGPSAVLWVGGLAASASIAFARFRAGDPTAVVPSLGRFFERRGLIVVVLLLLALANGFTARGLHPMFIKSRIEILEEHFPLFEKWNSFSRVALFESGTTQPLMWGPSPTFIGDRWHIEQRVLNIDGLAGTPMYGIQGDVAKADFLKYDVTSLAYYLKPQKTAAVIGVGGGRDLVAARVFGVSEVTGVEINPIFVELLLGDNSRFADFTGLGKLPRMTLVVDEARNWFARGDQVFDIIQMSMVDTWAATGAGAFTLSENGLYTVRAWQIFMRHLSPTGVFTVSRWYDPEAPNETGRMVSLAMASLFEMGISKPHEHIFVATSGRVATLIVSVRPFSQDQLAVLTAVSRDLQYKVLLAPNQEPSSNLLKALSTSADLPSLQAVSASFILDYTPPTDDRPFFFNQLPLNKPAQTLMLALQGHANQTVLGNMQATGTLGLLFVISLLLVIATIVLPLRRAVSDVGRTFAVAGTSYFVLIGIGFMCIEIGLLQRMSVFLGHPTYSLSIVLFSLILATGIGSLVSDGFPLRTTSRLAIWALVVGAYFLVLPGLLSASAQDLEGKLLAIRAAVAVTAIAPGGFLMGWGFPTGMALVSSIDRTPAPWFWGINGASGVLASSFAVMISIAYGIGTTIRIGGICYLLLIPAALMLLAGGRVSAALVDPAERAMAAGVNNSTI